MSIFLYSAIFLLGLCLGSFTSVLITRELKGEPWHSMIGFRNHEQSACVHCGYVLSSRDLVPLLSWLSTYGRCRYCKHSLGLFYPILELSLAGLSLFSFMVVGWQASTVFILASLPFLVALTYVDIKQKRLPNMLNSCLFLIGLVFAVWCYTETQSVSVFINYFIGMLVFVGAIWSMRWFVTLCLKKESLGFGDVKFFGVAGLWLGWNAIGVFCFLAGIIGVLFGLIWRYFQKENTFPFGPALILSFYLLFLMQHSVIYRDFFDNILSLKFLL